ncbi:MAG TPA: electron transfer flavoprotein subunit beta/FixA family protein [Syntrophales bacterium]|nr:electron transfer flavoprotein subunit beta/FixA family protein [Syntrophales bacterium]HPN25600.1 electron transfer flavoprotein subunit beta/FixA family protein [Syntrophales bacterium]HQM28142.1 electron transfer flavoprotein subunit beta/FixA family protein [Syntrophales bacterium]
MDIIVFVKPVLDPDMPPAKFSVDGKTNRVIPPEGMPLVISPYDALAVEAALKIKEAAKGAKITAVTMAGPFAVEVLRKAVAMGADEAVQINDPAFEDSDAFSTALILAAAVKKIGKCDIILCGRQAADWDNGVVGSVIAEYLGFPSVIRAKGISVADGKLKVERVITNGFEIFEVGLPAVVTLSSEMGQARIPTGWGIINAAKKQIQKWSAADLGVDAAGVGKAAARNQLVKLYTFSPSRTCEMVTGKDEKEAAEKLAEKIMDIKP